MRIHVTTRIEVGDERLLASLRVGIVGRVERQLGRIRRYRGSRRRNRLRGFGCITRLPTFHQHTRLARRFQFGKLPLAFGDLCLLQVLTLYSPKSHKLNFLRSQAESHDLRLIEVWPRDTRFAPRCFELLRRAYVDARYSPHYKITPEELEWIGQRIDLLQSLAKQICEERLALG
ncbi:MAG TPA: hypothetical protein VFT56_01635 [Sphingomonas sp.]|nr:hypothetical protein [Sphingomonas sp.]